MGKQAESFGKLEGTIGDITYYKMDGQYYARQKSSLSRQKVLTDPKFANTRKHAAELADGSKIAADAYRLVEGNHRSLLLYRNLTGIAIRCIREGMGKKEILCFLVGLLVREKIIPDLNNKPESGKIGLILKNTIHTKASVIEDYIYRLNIDVFYDLPYLVISGEMKKVFTRA